MSSVEELDKLITKLGFEASLRALIVWLTRQKDNRAHRYSTLFALHQAYDAYAICLGMGASYRAAQRRLREALEALK